MLVIFATESEVFGFPIVAKSKKQAIEKMQKYLDDKAKDIKENIEITKQNINMLELNIEEFKKDAEIKTNETFDKEGYIGHMQETIKQDKVKLAEFEIALFKYEIKASSLDAYCIKK